MTLQETANALEMDEYLIVKKVKRSFRDPKTKEITDLGIGITYTKHNNKDGIADEGDIG